MLTRWHVWAIQGRYIMLDQITSSSLQLIKQSYLQLDDFTWYNMFTKIIINVHKILEIKVKKDVLEYFIYISYFYNFVMEFTNWLILIKFPNVRNLNERKESYIRIWIIPFLFFGMHIFTINSDGMIAFPECLFLLPLLYFCIYAICLRLVLRSIISSHANNPTWSCTYPMHIETANHMGHLDL